MTIKTTLISLVFSATACLFPTFGYSYHSYDLTDTNYYANTIPPRYQWDSNNGYCGEVSLISAGLYYGQYISQYGARTAAIGSVPQNKGQLLLGQNDQTAAAQMRLNTIEWDSVSEQSTDQFLVWVKENVTKGYPVAIGIYTNEYQFYHDADPDAGDSEYDHIVPVYGIGTNHAVNDPHYYGDDLIYFSDNGLWGDSTNPPYDFSYSFDAFQATRREANAKQGAIYSLSNSGTNYGIAVTGVMDLHGDTYPIRITVSVDREEPEIADGSNARPLPKPIVLTVTISDLQPGVPYILYRYNTLESVPTSQFNAHAENAYEALPFTLTSGTTHVLIEHINSDEVAVYRCVKASAP